MLKSAREIVFADAMAKAIRALASEASDAAHAFVESLTPPDLALEKLEREITRAELTRAFQVDCAAMIRREGRRERRRNP